MYRRNEEFIQILVRKPEGKRPCGRPRHKWEDNIIMDLMEVGGDDVDWVHLAQDRGSVVGSCEHGNTPSGSVKGREFVTLTLMD